MRKIGNLNHYVLLPNEDQVKLAFSAEEAILSQQNINHDYDKNYFSTNTVLKRRLNLIVDSGKTFDDINFKVSTPFLIRQETEQDTISNISLATKINLQNNTNFYNNSYLKFSKKEQIDEINLLNFYIWSAKDIKNNLDIEKIVTNGNRIDDSLFSKNTIQEYYNNYVSTYDSWQEDFNSSYKNKLKNLVFIEKDLPYSDITSDLFPYYLNIDFYKERAKDFNEIVEETKQEKNIFKKITEIGSQEDSQTLLMDLKTINLINLDLEQSSISSSQSSTSVKFFDLSTLFEDNQSDIETFYIESEKTEEENVFLKNLLNTVFIKKVDNLVKKNLRDYKEILQNKECYSEQLAIKVEKIRLDSNGQELETVQRFYFKNNKKDLLKFIDTQITDGEKYTYKFFYYTLVIGNRYSYNEIISSLPLLTRELVFGNTTENEFLLQNNSLLSGLYITNKPLVYIFEIPITTTLLNPITPQIENPPIAPVVIPIPYKDIKNKIKFNFQKAFGSYKEQFIILEDSDEDILSNILDSQNKKIGEQVEFGNKNSDINFTKQNYEIFRTTQNPLEYSDFKDKKIKAINSDSFIDELQFNTKYYYTFRAINETNNYKSNPSVIYEIEIVNNSDVFYPIIKVYNFNKMSGLSTEKSFKRYIYIKPSYNQFIINNLNNLQTASTDLTFGVGPTAWNRNFKLRLTSKQTGRKIDFNFKLKIGNRIVLDT